MVMVGHIGCLYRIVETYQGGCFVNGPERKTLEEMEWVGNQSVYEDIPNFAAEGNQ